MLRYKTKRPGLVALCDIRPRNGAGLFPGARTGHQSCLAPVVDTDQIFTTDIYINVQRAYFVRGLISLR